MGTARFLPRGMSAVGEEAGAAGGLGACSGGLRPTGWGNGAVVAVALVLPT